MNDPIVQPWFATLVCRRVGEVIFGNWKMACLLEAGQSTTSATVLPPKDMRYVPGKSGFTMFMRMIQLKMGVYP